MFIKELELFGFKSFKEKTILRFAPGLNCVVGPNGCGKSNILDALRWVLGEQPCSLLRCAKNEDLIFAGTARMPPLNYAEVRLVLSLNHLQELENTTEGKRATIEVEIRRRCFRSGESEYYLNRQPCRLRDIQDFFLSQGIGIKAYSIFDLQEMRDIISGNIRQMFEEAATLAKFRNAKEECQRKLELTSADLTRLDDIIAERERVVHSLQRQATKLRTYKRLKEEERKLRLRELQQTYEQLKERLKTAQEETSALEQAQAERLKEIHQLEEELRKLRTGLFQKESVREQLTKELDFYRQQVVELQTKEIVAEQEKEHLTNSIKVGEREIARFTAELKQFQELLIKTERQLKEGEEQLEKMERELSGLRAGIREKEEQILQIRTSETPIRKHLQGLIETEGKMVTLLTRLSAEKENLNSRLADNQTQLEDLNGRINYLESDLNRAKEQEAELQRAISSANERRSLLLNQLKDLEIELRQIRQEKQDLQAEKRGLEQEIKALQSQIPETNSSVLRFIEPNPGWEQTIEAALYTILNFSVLPEGKLQAVINDEIAQRDALWVIHYPLRPSLVTTERKQGVRNELLEDDPRVQGRLSNYVKIKPQAPQLIEQMIESFLVASDRKALQELIVEYPQEQFVTKDGIVWFGDGRLVIKRGGLGPLTALVQIKEKEERVLEIKKGLEESGNKEIVLTKREGELRKELEQVESELVVAKSTGTALATQISTQQALLAEVKKERELLQAEMTGIESSLAEVTQKISTTKKEKEDLSREIAGEENNLHQLEATAEALEEQVKKQLKNVTELLATIAENRSFTERLKVEHKHILRAIEEKEHQVDETKKMIDQAKIRIEQIQKEEGDRAQVLTQLQEKISVKARELGRFSVGEVTRAVETVEANLSELREIQEKGQELLLRQHLQVAEIETQLKRVVDDARTIAPLTATGSSQCLNGVLEFPAVVQDGEEKITDWVKELQLIRERLATLGEVNPLAIEEYEQERKDLQRLIFQREDVLQAKTKLEESLKEIDRHARDAFLSTYNKVREEFQVVFKELFLEGEADLVLVNDANPLESEVAIIAKPKGKNPRRLEQLSDGEKAMLAISLLFAFYRVKSAPFCFLDEVDAPLDDANVNRFAEYLKRLSARTQVIIITHNKATIERADAIFGVTVEEVGVSKLVSVDLRKLLAAGPTNFSSIKKETDRPK